MNKTLHALLLGLVVATPSHADPFVGTGSPGPLAISVTGNLPLNAGGGSATASPTALVLVGGNQDPYGCTGGTFEVNGPCQIQAIDAVPGTFSFTWSSSTADGAGPGGDQFSYGR